MLLGPFLVHSQTWVDFFAARGAQLQGFLITQSPRFDLACIEALGTHCAASLNELRLMEIGKLSDEFLPHIAKCSKLSSLDLSYPDKSLSVDGVPVSSSSNTVTGVSSGVTLNLQGATGGASTTLDVTANGTQIASALSQFVTDYNSAVSLLSSQFTFSASSGSEGALGSDMRLNGK